MKPEITSSLLVDLILRKVGDANELRFPHHSSRACAQTPDISEVLGFYESAFDAKLAEANGFIIPKKVHFQPYCHPTLLSIVLS